jgi:hypothetical protein
VLTCFEFQLVNTDKIDLACTVLIAADQLINGRLKSLCEVALADLLTLKNCAGRDHDKDEEGMVTKGGTVSSIFMDFG